MNVKCDDDDDEDDEEEEVDEVQVLPSATLIMVLQGSLLWNFETAKKFDVWDLEIKEGIALECDILLKKGNARG